MHRLRRFVLCMAMAATPLGMSPAFDEGGRSLQADGADFLYMRLWAFEFCWSDCAEGAVCCKLVYLVEE
jgi:hypothetical protein